MSTLDALNVAYRRYLRDAGLRHRLDPEIDMVEFTHFVPAQASKEIVGRMLARAAGKWYYVNIVLTLEEFEVNSSQIAIWKLLEEKTDTAIQQLNELAGDSFGRWVREQRKEHGL